MSPLEKHSRECMAKHELRPIEDPMGDDHHTDAPFTREDEEIAELAYWLGGLFVDKQNYRPSDLIGATYYYQEMTSLDVWRRVARALRLHGLKIVNADPK